MTLPVLTHSHWSDDLLWRQLRFCSLQDISRSKSVDRRWHRVIQEMQQPSPWLSQRIWKEWWIPKQDRADESLAVVGADLQDYPRRKYVRVKGSLRDAFFFAHWLVGPKNIVTSDIEHVHIWNNLAQIVNVIHAPILKPHAVCLTDGTSSKLVITATEYTGLFALETGETLQTVASLGHSVFPLAGGRVAAVAQEGTAEILTVYSTASKRFALDDSEISWHLKTPPHLIQSVSEQLHVIANLRGKTYVWKSGTSSTMGHLPIQNAVSYITPLKTNKIALTPIASEKVHLFDLNTSSQLRSYTFQIDTQSIAIPHNNLLLYSKNSKYTGLVDMRLPDVVTKWSHASWVTGAVWSGYGPYVWTSCAENLSCWDVRMNKSVQQIILRSSASIQGRLCTGEIVLRSTRAQISLWKWTGGLFSMDPTPKVKKKLRFPGMLPGL